MGLPQKLAGLLISTMLSWTTPSAPSWAAAPEPQLRVRAAEVDCDFGVIRLHGEFDPAQLTATLDRGDVVESLAVAVVDADTVVLTLAGGCDPPGTYRLTVGTDVGDAVTTTTGKVRPPQFHTVLDVTLGAVGPEGVPGPAGPQGVPGRDGVDGIDGAPGEDGSKWLTGSTPPDDGVGVDGDFYLQQSEPGTGDVFEKTSGAWRLVGNIRGPQGIQGVQGETGAQGAQGPPGVDGVDGAPGVQGLACWDLDGSRSCDVLEPGNEANEDLSGDGACTVLDCRGPQGEPGPAGNLALAGQVCPPPDSIVGFDASGGILCSSQRNVEVCDGADNDLDGVADDGLVYCIGGSPAPNTDGGSCSPGFFDVNLDPADGCEGVPITEICDGVDNDLDGTTDEGLIYCIAGDPAANTDGASCDAGFFDLNADRLDGCESDTAPVEICDGIDNDFDGLVDEECVAAISSVDFCRLVFPTSIFGAPGQDVAVFGRFYIPGLTDQSLGNDISPLVEGQVGYGESTDASSWTWTDADYNPSYDAASDSDGTLDEMQGSLIIPVAGNYYYGFRFRTLDPTTGIFEPYAYCDTAGLVDGTASDAYGIATLFGDVP